MYCGGRRNLNYWDSVSTLAGEVAHPATVFPKALMTAVLLVVAMYLLPLLACLGVQPLDGQAWRLGYFATVAKQARPPPSACAALLCCLILPSPKSSLSKAAWPGCLSSFIAPCQPLACESKVHRSALDYACPGSESVKCHAARQPPFQAADLWGREGRWAAIGCSGG